MDCPVIVVVEKRLFYGLDKARTRLVAALDGIVPRLTSTRILANLERNIAEQTNAFRDFNTGLAPMLQRSFSESMGPTLQRMASVIDELNQMMRAAEAQKQESITGSLDALLRNLEQSLNKTIEQMGASFSQSLSGSTMSQFDNVAESLKGTATLLESMNTQFSSTKAALNELIDYAKLSTAEQMSMGRGQVEELTNVLGSLMEQLKQTTDSSVGNMSATLTAVVHSLSSDVKTLSEQMSTTMQESSQQATGAANAMIERADSWSTRNAEQLATLLEKHQDQLAGIDKLRTVLDSSLGSFNQSLRQHSEIVSSLQSIAREVNGTVLSIRSASDAAAAIELGACRIVNIKQGRVGGIPEAVRIHDVCRAAGIPMWCGGMLETGIGRATNLALAALPGFTLPGDTSASARYFADDVTTPFVMAPDGTMEIPRGPGIGVTPRPDRLEATTLRVELLTP
jgi:hypothetical protein